MNSGFNSIIISMKEDNFFLGVGENHFGSEPSRRLNDYDYNILKEDAYKDISNELFKLEYRISRLEEELKSVDMQIQSSRDISDYDTVEILMNRKHQLQDDLSALVEVYNEKSLSAKISGGIFNIFKDKFSKITDVVNTFKDSVISVLPGKFSSAIELKQSLSKLESINKSVDELMTMQTPYGEAGDKYEQLSKYITRANAIQAKIARSLK